MRRSLADAKHKPKLRKPESPPKSNHLLNELIKQENQRSTNKIRATQGESSEPKAPGNAGALITNNLPPTKQSIPPTLREAILTDTLENISHHYLTPTPKKQHEQGS